jgi:YebC/PmpR family DNA-binding regulatory protein
MAGHSHWANIAYKKAAVDKKRGKVYSKIARMIIAAAKVGGGDPDMNLKLKYAVAEARAANMTNEQVKRAIDRGTGATASENYEEVLYEGYAPGGAAVLVEGLTDNRKRTAPEIRGIFEKAGGNLGASGSVAWQFARKATVRIPAQGVDEDGLMMAVLDAGAEDMERAGDVIVVRGPAEALHTIQQAVGSLGLVPASSGIEYVPMNFIAVPADTGRSIVHLLEALEENDDVQRVHTNAEFPDGFEG